MSLELSLFQIEDGLRDLYAMREETRAAMLEDTAGVSWNESQAQLAVINEAILNYLRAEVKKVDGTADFILMLDRLAHEPRDRKGVTERCEIDQEIDRLRARRDNLRELMQNVKDNVAFVMGEMPWREGKPKKLEGVRHSITLRGNGGAQPVEIHDESLVPDDLCRVTVTMSADLWRAIAEHVYECEHTGEFDGEFFKIMPKREVSKSAVAEAIQKPCPKCDKGLMFNPEWPKDKPIAEGYIIDCDQCGGTGKAGVPGARLADRGVSVVIK